MRNSHRVVNSMQFSKSCKTHELLILSYKRRLYHHLNGVLHFHPLECTSLWNSRWSFSYSELTCWFSILKHLGFNLMLYTIVFSTFVTFTLSHISYLRCSLTSFTSFQQFNGFWIGFTYHSILFTNMGGCQQFSKL